MNDENEPNSESSDQGAGSSMTTIQGSTEVDRETELLLPISQEDGSGKKISTNPLNSPTDGEARIILRAEHDEIDEGDIEVAPLSISEINVTSAPKRMNRFKRRNKPDIPRKYKTWPKHIFTLRYLRLFKSPIFMLTFTIAAIARCNAFIDVFTDLLQAVKFWDGIERVYCGGIVVLSNTTVATFTNFTNSSTYAMLNITANSDDQKVFLVTAKDPFWFTITVISIFMPAVICIVRYPMHTIKSQFLFHRFRLVCDKDRIRELSVSTVKGRRKKVLATLKSCIQGFGIFISFPILILFRQLRQLILMIEIEYLNQRLLECLEQLSMIDKLKNCLSIDNLKSLARGLCPISAQQREMVKRKNTEEKENEKILVKVIRDALGNPDYTPPLRSVLTDQLTSLSRDRHDEALIETTPQSVLNLALMYRYGGDLLPQISLTFSFYSLVSSSTAYITDKLKLNPVKRELNTFGKLLTFFTKFPVTLSRCVLLSIVYSTKNLAAKLVCTLFFLVYGLCAMVVEYLSIFEVGRGNLSVRFIQELLIRGYTSIFTLMEYRLKICDKEGQILDEADIEAIEGTYEEPRRRFWQQIMYLVANSIINAAFIAWFLFYSGEDICAPGFFNYYDGNYVDVRWFWSIIVVIGAPLSMLFSLIMNFDIVRSCTTEIGLKAVEALNYHIRVIIKKGHMREVESLVPLINSLSERERKRVIMVNHPKDDRSLLFHVLEIKPLSPTLFFQFRDLGFPMKKDVNIARRLYAALEKNSTSDITRVRDLLNGLSEEERHAVIDIMEQGKHPSGGKSVLYYVLESVLMRKTDQELFRQFCEMGFQMEDDLGQCTYTALQYDTLRFSYQYNKAKQRKVLHFLSSLSEQSRNHIMTVMGSVGKQSVLYHILESILRYELDWELFGQFCEMGFPVEDDLGECIYTALRYPTLYDVRRVYNFLCSLSEQSRNHIMTVMASVGKQSVLYHILNSIFRNKLDWELFGQFCEMGFPVEDDLGECIYTALTNDARMVLDFLSSLSEQNRDHIIETLVSVSGKSVIFLLNYALSTDLDFNLLDEFCALGFEMKENNEDLIGLLSRPFPVAKSNSGEKRILSAACIPSTHPQLYDVAKILPPIPLSLFPASSDMAERSAFGTMSVKTEQDILYIMGGIYCPFSSVLAYDVAKRQSSVVYTSMNSVEIPNMYGSSCSILGENVYVFGGRKRDETLTRRLYTFGLSNHSWNVTVQKGDRPPARYGHIQWSWQNGLFVFGGWLGEDINDNRIYRFEVNTNTWEIVSTSGTSPNPRRSVAHFLSNDVLYIHGGLGESGYSDEIFNLNMNSLTWMPIKVKGELKLPPAIHARMIIHNGNLVILGGRGEAGFYSTTYNVNLSSNALTELLTLPSLHSGNENEKSVDGKSIGLVEHHMHKIETKEGNARVVVVGGVWGARIAINETPIPNRFIVEFGMIE